MSQISTQLFVLDTAPGAELAALDTVRNAVELTEPSLRDIGFVNLETGQVYGFAPGVWLGSSLLPAQSNLNIRGLSSLVSSTQDVTFSNFRTHLLESFPTRIVHAIDWISLTVPQPNYLQS